MIRRNYICLIILLLVCCNVNAENSIYHKLEKFLPDLQNIKPWNQPESPEKFREENLYSYINGGADIYLEYGFSEVISANYIFSDHDIKVEIYKMNGDSSAFGIYSSFQNGKGKIANYGNEGTKSEYYASFWKNKFFVVITGSDKDTITLNMIHKIATEVDGKLPSGGRKPYLTRLLTDNNLIEKNLRYFVGELGLTDYYNFGVNNLFNLTEGVGGEQDTFKLFLFKYSDNSECEAILDTALDKIKAYKRNSKCKKINNGLYYIDRLQNPTICASYKNFIIVAVDDNPESSKSELHKIINEIIDTLSAKN